METDQVHVAEVCAELYHEFHYNAHHTDMTVECEGQKFRCHRIVLAAGSGYFEGMFNNKVWTENVTRSVVLAGNDIKAATLLEVLKYLYTGKATITSSNFVDLLYASDYLLVPKLEALCVQILLQNRPKPIINLLEVLFFAHSVSNQSLINVLASCNMTKRLKKFFRTKEFLDINKDLFLTIVSKLWRAPYIMNIVLRRAICRWQAQALEEREQDAQELYEILKQTLKISFDRSVGSSHSLLEVRPNLDRIVAATPNPSLYVYSRGNDDMMRMYRYNSMNPRSKKFGLEQSFAHEWNIFPLRFVSIDKVGVFSMAYRLETCLLPIFTQFASANICDFVHGLALAPPPPLILLRDFELCNMSNRGLYLLLRKSVVKMPQRHIATYDTSKQEFSEDEIKRGIYFYNIELDRWYPVPAMISRPHESCMTVLDNMLYVIESHDYRRMVQAYDHRERRWQRKSHVLHCHTDAQSCVLDGSIYVRSSEYCDRYDPVAARWEHIGGMPRDNHYEFQRLIPYDHQLWQFSQLVFRGLNDHDSIRLNHLIEAYNPRTASWSLTPGMDALETMIPNLNEEILDAVVW